jgi:hypothetical protein
MEDIMKPEIFWRNVDIKTDDECWEWKLSRTPQGYGRVRCWGKERAIF